MAGFLSGIFNPSSGTPVNGGPAPAALPAPAAPPAPPAGNNAPPADPPAPPPGPTSSLDKYVAMWQNATTPDGKPVPQTGDPLAQPLFNFDAVKVQESANQMDFTAGINPETITKALSGDAAAFTEALNQGIRAAVVGMTMSNGQLINNAVVSNNQRITAQLPTHIKQHQLLDSSPDENPAFQHPAAQPLVQALKKMAFAKDPNAKVEDINKQISGFLSGFATALTEGDPANVKQQQQVAKGETDWSLF